METKVKDFNAVAATWDENPRRVQLGRAVADSIKANIEIPQKCQALEFGCGTGLVTFNLVRELDLVVAADRAQEMLDVVRKKAQDLGAEGVETQLVSDDLTQLGRSKYDFIYSNMVLHHLPDIEAVLGHLVAALKPGGIMALSDLENDDGTFHDQPEGIIHSGITSQWLLETMGRMGFEDLHATQAHNIVKQRPEGRKDYPVFLVWGRLAES